MVSTTTSPTDIHVPTWTGTIVLAIVTVLGLVGALTYGDLIMWVGAASWAVSTAVTGYSTWRNRTCARTLRAFYEQEATN